MKRATLNLAKAALIVALLPKIAAYGWLEWNLAKCEGRGYLP